MQPGAYFGKPRAGQAPGGFHVTVHLVPVLEGRLVAFDIDGPGGIAGRWLPWAVLPFQANPYEEASLLADTWCDVPMLDLTLVDVLSFRIPGEGWELALVFRTELAEPPPSADGRRPVLTGPGEVDAIGPFDPADLQRWLGAAVGVEPPPADPLVF